MFNFSEKIRKIKLPFFSVIDICFDLGTSNTRIAIGDKGIILKEPTYLGYDEKIKDYIFFGKEAKEVMGKTPDFIKINRPIVNGVISDFDAEIALLKHYFQLAVKPYLKSFSLIKPYLIAITAVPIVASEIEIKAIEEAFIKLGFSEVFILEKPLAVALGNKINVFSHLPYLIIDLGGGLTELSIISSGGIVVKKTLKNAGETMNKLIANYIYLKYGVILGESTCEELKINLLNFNNEEKIINVRGKSLENGLPKSLKIKSHDIKEALTGAFNQILDATKELIELSPPEIIDEIFNYGIILSGGLAKIRGLDKFLAKELKLEVLVSNNPEDATINGLFNICKNPEDLVKLSLPKI
jgi:rod shape-determining protein MreB